MNVFYEEDGGFKVALVREEQQVSAQLQELMDAIAAYHEHGESNVMQSESGR